MINESKYIHTYKLFRSNKMWSVFQEKELENLAAMDVELQKIAAKLHDNSA